MASSLDAFKRGTEQIFGGNQKVQIHGATRLYITWCGRPICHLHNRPPPMAILCLVGVVMHH